MLNAFKEKWATMDTRKMKKTITAIIVLVLFFLGMLWFAEKYPPRVVVVKKETIEKK